MTKQFILGLAAAACWIAIISGCSGDRSVVGGTEGTLRIAMAELRDVRIDVYPTGASEPIGFGVTGDGGRFELYQPNAKGALRLEPGEYSFTLEPIGPEPLALRPQLRDPRRTPLRKHWSENDSLLELAIP